MQTELTDILIEKIRSLPDRRRSEVEDFVDFLSRRDDELLIGSGMKLSEPSFESVWDNDEDAAYDAL